MVSAADESEVTVHSILHNIISRLICPKTCKQNNTHPFSHLNFRFSIFSYILVTQAVHRHTDTSDSKPVSPGKDSRTSAVSPSVGLASSSAAASAWSRKPAGGEYSKERESEERKESGSALRDPAFLGWKSTHSFASPSPGFGPLSRFGRSKHWLA